MIGTYAAQSRVPFASAVFTWSIEARAGGMDFGSTSFGPVTLPVPRPFLVETCVGPDKVRRESVEPREALQQLREWAQRGDSAPPPAAATEAVARWVGDAATDGNRREVGGSTYRVEEVT